MVKAVKALNSSASEGQENTIPLQKKKPIITIIFKLHISKVYFGLKHCTPKLLSLQNYINKPRGKKRWYYKKKNQQKRNALFP